MSSNTTTAPGHFTELEAQTRDCFAKFDELRGFL
jgi:hypothetical protein